MIFDVTQHYREANDDGDLLQENTGRIVRKAEAQEMIRQTIALMGRFILAAAVPPRIGEVQWYAGLPMRAVRIVDQAEARQDKEATQHIWDYQAPWDPELVYFEVEVAD